MASNSTTKNKRQEEKYVQMIRDLAALPMNKQCFDCNSKGPTYVDVTVGSFVCTACSGLLRGLNPPHRLKSINMSTFTQDEVEFMRNHGNQLNKLVYLGLYDANAGFSPDPKDTERFKEFLSQKYERKRWYVAPTESMKQKVKADADAVLEKASNAATTKSTSSTLIHSNSVTSSIKSPTEPVPNSIRTARTPSLTSAQPPMLVFDAPVSHPASTTSPTSLFDELYSPKTTNNTSPTKSFFPEQPFSQATSSNEVGWGAFVEPAKPAVSHTVTMPTNAFAHPPAEPVDKYAALSDLFNTQSTLHEQQPSIFGNTSNGAHRSSTSGPSNSVFGNTPFSSHPPPASSNVMPNFSAQPQQQQQQNFFPSQPFPTQFPAASNPFQAQMMTQQPFGTGSSTFGMATNGQANPFLNIAQQPSALQQQQQQQQQFGKPRTNSTNPFL